MTEERLKIIADARMKSVSTLMEADDWFFAAHTMAMALECFLKAKICKTLCLNSYPQDLKRQEKIVHFFWTHEFAQLLILSGLSKEFDIATGIPEVVQNWNDFTKEFTGEWSGTRYNYDRQRQFDQTKTERLYKNLTDPDYGIFKTIQKKW